MSKEILKQATGIVKLMKSFTWEDIARITVLLIVLLAGAYVYNNFITPSSINLKDLEKIKEIMRN